MALSGSPANFCFPSRRQANRTNDTDLPAGRQYQQ
ncbi:hypothetical protein C8N39_10933 [Dietzia psychralcaliphila]|nr:hypothetical protein C8N39_10933 [Dietzia psychralcaliphila]